jgi:hypothetical protein
MLPVTASAESVFGTVTRILTSEPGAGLLGVAVTTGFCATAVAAPNKNSAAPSDARAARDFLLIACVADA